MEASEAPAKTVVCRSAVAVTVCLELARRVPGSAPQTALSELLFGLSVVNPDSIKQVFGETVFIALFALALM